MALETASATLDAASPSVSEAWAAARRPRQNTDGRPPVSRATATRPPSIDAFLAKWNSCSSRSSPLASQKR